jgi:hypothetical protein
MRCSVLPKAQPYTALHPIRNSRQLRLVSDRRYVDCLQRANDIVQGYGNLDKRFGVSVDKVAGLEVDKAADGCIHKPPITAQKPPRRLQPKNIKEDWQPSK